MNMRQLHGRWTRDDVLTMEEIKARYAPDWVLIAEPVTDDMQRLLRGKVVFHGPDGDECWHYSGLLMG